MDLKDKVVIVTGSARGLGRAFAARFAQEGAKVVVCDILDGSETARQIASSGGTVLTLHTDVTSVGDTLEMARKTVERFGRIDVLVNNAAMQADIVRKPFWEIDSVEWDRVMAVNLKGTFLCTKAVFPFMKAQGSGKIVNISSGTAFDGGHKTVHYTTSKAGVVGFTRAMAKELGEFNINVNAVAPGQVPTEVYVVPEDRRRSVAQGRCLKREATPQDLMGAVLFLASSDAAFITGQTLVVDGGGVFH